MKRKLVTLVGALAALALVASPATAQPLGQFVATGAGQGGGPHVKVFVVELADSIVSPTPVMEIMAYSPAFTGGVYLGVGTASP